MSIMNFFKKKKKRKKIGLSLILSNAKSIYNKCRYALPRMNIDTLSLLRSCGELWLQQTWKMIFVSECLRKGLFYAKELGWFGTKSKKPLCLWGWAVCCFLLAKYVEVQPTWSPAPSPLIPVESMPRLYCGNRHSGNLAIFEDWNHFVTTMRHSVQYFSGPF